ncbi:hypothetical protein Celaphus_00013238 [Cervus elaphus hippelaphus]|uniref:EGF-like domain-containing protein n=1 Tax=Cervus elaphus hippelaphus TaxID=46360 RepID=A0A212DFW5_CEREH|nr:hypothetical protein Celaphus_00013238 [Cervus elaphus hippelaphus]
MAASAGPALPLQEGPLCPGTGCGPDNGGCEHECVEAADGRVSCRCSEGFRLAADGRSCEDPCAHAPCEQQCEPGGPQGYSCHCRLGFRPAEDEPHRCVDTDECQIAGVCQQMCVNYDLEDGLLDEGEEEEDEEEAWEAFDVLSVTRPVVPPVIPAIHPALPSDHQFPMISANYPDLPSAHRPLSPMFPDTQVVDTQNTTRLPRIPANHTPLVTSSTPQVPREGTPDPMPTCVFLVVLLALGIVYCTRCGPHAPNKRVTDCYRWVTHAGSKGPTEPAPHRGSLTGVQTCRTSV